MIISEILKNVYHDSLDALLAAIKDQNYRRTFNWLYLNGRADTGYLRIICDENKDFIIKSILLKIKEDHNQFHILKRIQFVLQLLSQTLNLDWPELEIIWKSIPSKDRIAEDFHDESIMDDIIQTLRIDLNTGGTVSDIVYAIMSIRQRIKNPEIPFEIIQTVNKYKEKILKYILIILKNNSKDDWEWTQLSTVLSCLKFIKIDWPELKVIEKSLASDV